MIQTTKEEYYLIAKHLEPIFHVADPSIKNIKYLQVQNKDLFQFEYDKKVRYIDVSNEDPFHVLNIAVCTLDEYNLSYMFLSEQEEEILGLRTTDFDIER